MLPLGITMNFHVFFLSSVTTVDTIAVQEVTILDLGVQQSKGSLE